MNIKERKAYLKAQIVQLKGLHGLVKDHPVMGKSYKYRIEEVQKELDALPVDIKEAKAELRFFGDAVVGDRGINAQFSSETLKIFQQIIDEQYVFETGATKQKRGRKNNSLKSESSLLVTNVTRGSFGFVLEKREDMNMFDADNLSKTIAHIVSLLEKLQADESEFSRELDSFSPGSLKKLSDFFTKIKAKKSGFTLSSGTKQIEFSVESTKDAHARLKAVEAKDEEITLDGIFKGARLESGDFDFEGETGQTIKGKLGRDLSEEDVVKYIQEYINKRCRANFRKTTISYLNADDKYSFELIKIEAAS